jgi:hypothetical protein
VHDRFGTGWMLQTDGLSAILFLVVGLFFVKKIKANGLRVWRRTIAPTRTARTPQQRLLRIA